MVDRVNRIVLLLIGGIVAGLGGAVLATRAGWLDLDEPSTIYRDLEREILSAERVALVITLVACSVVAVIAAVWLWRQFASRPGGPHLSTMVMANDRRGATTIEPVELARAIANDLETVSGVHKATVRMLELGSTPSMAVRLGLDRSVDPDQVLADIEPAVDRGRAVLDADRMTTRIRLDLDRRDGARVV